MQATRALARSHRASRVIAALPIIATTFFMHAMVWHYFRQLKMSRPDTYGSGAVSPRDTRFFMFLLPTVHAGGAGGAGRGWAQPTL